MTLGLVRALTAARATDLTSAGIEAAVKSAPPVPCPLGGGATFQCGGKTVSLSPNLCNASGLMADISEDRTPSGYQVISANDLFAAGGRAGRGRARGSGPEGDTSECPFSCGTAVAAGLPAVADGLHFSNTRSVRLTAARGRPGRSWRRAVEPLPVTRPEYSFNINE
ncbi:hypothetical protein [Amycolatopsis thermoflava]|uniref:hypothetical protein n=1 Tax=Amycolatopsis thermoflava TaxID=84480 RepID=UPI00381A6EEA